MSPFEMYMLMQADIFRDVFVVLLALSCMGIFFAAFGAFDAYEPCKRALPKIAAVAAVMLFLVATFPSSKGLLAIYGVSAISDIEGIDKLPNKSVQAIDKLLSDYLEGADK